jgi:hypothetical protein
MAGDNRSSSEGKECSYQGRSFLQIALIAFGMMFCLCYPLAIVWPSGWAWHEGPSAASRYFMMIVGINATLSLCPISAARDQRQVYPLAEPNNLTA